MNIVNCTPHAITVMTSVMTFDNENNCMTEVMQQETYEPSGILPRVETVRVSRADLTTNNAAGIRIIAQKVGQVQGLPEPQADTVFIVSAMVLQALAGSRPDVYAPDTGADAIRNDKGHIIAVRGFVAG